MLLQMENDNVGIDRYYNNTGQNVITITEDRLQLRAKEYEENLNLAKWGYSSIATTLSTLIAICTSNFKDMLYFSKETWEAFFCLVCLGGFFLYMSVDCYLFYKKQE